MNITNYTLGALHNQWLMLWRSSPIQTVFNKPAKLVLSVRVVRYYYYPNWNHNGNWKKANFLCENSQIRINTLVRINTEKINRKLQESLFISYYKHCYTPEFIKDKFVLRRSLYKTISRKSRLWGTSYTLGIPSLPHYCFTALIKAVFNHSLLLLSFNSLVWK